MDNEEQKLEWKSSEHSSGEEEDDDDVEAIVTLGLF